MKHFQLSRIAITKLVASLIVLVIVIVSAGAIFAFNQLSSPNPIPTPTPTPTSTPTPMSTPTLTPTPTSTPTPSPSPSPTPSPTPCPSPTATPTPTPTLTPTPTPTQTIEISYIKSLKQSIVYVFAGYPYTEYPDEGKVFLEVNMTISNLGYDSFNTNPFYFFVIADRIKYSYDIIIFWLDCWDTVDIMNGGVYNGTLIFQIPTSASSISIGYESFYVTYNIVWTQL